MLKKTSLLLIFIFILFIAGCTSNVEDTEYNGGFYSGEWQLGKPNGSGKYTAEVENAVLTYEGDWRSGTMHGQGLLTHEGNDGSVLTYEGRWQNDKRHGEGLQVYDRGDGSFIIHEGVFVNDLLNGYGKMTVTYDSGDIFKSVEYEGDFVFGTKYGHGTEIEKDRDGNIISVKTGLWENDKFIG